MEVKAIMILPRDYSEIFILENVNQKIETILEFFIDVCETSSYEEHMEAIFPPDFFEEKTKDCIRIVRELYHYSRDKVPHHLSPIKEYALYNLFDWYLDVTEEDLNFTVTEASSDSVKDFTKTYGIEDFKHLIFDDHDFLDVDFYVELYTKNPQVLEMFDIDLGEYIDVMSIDKREDFLRLRKLQENPDTKLDLEELIVILIYKAIQKKQMNVLRLARTSETELSDDIADYMSAKLDDLNIRVEREKPGGFALKVAGELDFFIHQTSNGIYEKIAVGENKEWGSFEKQFKQLIGYMDKDIKFGFTIIFNKTVQLKTVLEGRKKILQNFSIESDGDLFFKVKKIEQVESLNDVIITYHSNPEDKSEFKIYHFIVNAFLPERLEAARQARAGRKQK